MITSLVLFDAKLASMNNENYQLALQAGSLLQAQSSSVGVAESCTGGGIAQALTAVPGSSEWFQLGLVTYSNVMKKRYLDVPSECLEGPGAPGAVSEQTVRHMVTGILTAADADYAVACSGIAGPGGGSADKPVGTVWLAWAARKGSDVQITARVFQFAGDRESVRQQTVRQSLQGLIDCCQASLNNNQ
tara:strand:- start:43283 stop:43849 length:567 start_codon:yes stop_codon:yes gene_type:complete